MSLHRIIALIIALLAIFPFVIACESGDDDDEGSDLERESEGDDDDDLLPGDGNDDPDFWGEGDDDVNDDFDDDSDDDISTTTTLGPGTTTTDPNATTTTTTTTSSTTTTQAPMLLWEDDFASYPTGDLKDLDIPWEVIGDFEAGGVRSQAGIVDVLGNRMLDMLGLTLPFFFVTVQYAFEDVFNDMQLNFKISYATAADDFQMFICRRGPWNTPIPTAQINLTGGRLYAKDLASPGLTDCGPIYAGYFASVEMRLRYDGSFDVILNGIPGDCVDMTQLSAESLPFGFIWIMDPADDGLGGYFLFDEFMAWATGG